MTISVKQAATRLGLGVRRVRVLCEQGRIDGARKVGRDWVIPDPPVILPPARARPTPVVNPDPRAH